MAKKIAVIYHGECWDGFSGAWAAWKKFRERADYFGLKHGDPLPDGLKNKEVYIIDFGFKEPAMKKILKENKKVVALDHHISAEKTTKMADEYVYQLNHSGAVIAWEYFHPQKSTPQLLRHIEDIDLWKFQLPNTREITAFLETVDYNFQAWDKIASDLENPARKKAHIASGKVIIAYQEKIISSLLQKADAAEFAGYKTLAVNSPILQSEIGAALVKKMPPIGIVWSEKEGARRVSLRSNGKIDVAKIAEKFGGGGHKAAAGFSLPANKPFPWRAMKD